MSGLVNTTGLLETPVRSWLASMIMHHDNASCHKAKAISLATGVEKYNPYTYAITGQP